FSAGLFTVIAALGVFFVAIRWKFSVSAALFAAAAYGLATPAWSYATLFMSHGVTAGCLTTAFYASFTMDRAAGRTRDRLAVLLGLAAGWAVVTEFQAAIPAAAFGLGALATVARVDRTAVVRVAALAAAGAAL